VESSESHEASYYEVALTNRQVLIAFVVLLTSVVAAFLSGVWIGRGGSSVARDSPGTAEHAALTIEAPLEQLTFFNGKDAGARVKTPAAAGAQAAIETPAANRPPAAATNRDAAAAVTPAESTAEARATEVMRQNLDATMAANRTAPAPVASAPPAASPAPAGTRLSTQPAPPGATPAKPAAATPKGSPATKPAATGKIFVQVYSSTNATRAMEIVAQLKKAGFAVAVAETLKSGGTTYRVRVGPYAERTKADSAASRLRREFRLETWVTDSP